MARWWLLTVWAVALVMAVMCSESHADERTPLHIGASAGLAFASGMVVHGMLGGEEREAAALMGFGTAMLIGTSMEIMQAGERNAPVDMGDIGANTLGAALGSLLLYGIAPEPRGRGQIRSLGIGPDGSVGLMIGVGF